MFNLLMLVTAASFAAGSGQASNPAAAAEQALAGVRAFRAQGAIEVDGKLDDAAWAQATPASRYPSFASSRRTRPAGASTSAA